VLPLHAGGPLTEPGIAVADWLAALLALIGVALYLFAAARLRRRGDAWPWPRDVCFTVGGVSLLIAALVRLPGGEFTAHTGQHLIVGMAAPLLLILARPLTLALRVMSRRPRRWLLWLSRSRGLGWLVFPPTAAVADFGALWLLYRTGLFAAIHDNPWLHAVVHLHVLLAGLLFTFAVCQVDPVRRRYGLVLRAGTVVVAGAAHAVLAKTLYGDPPPHTAFAATDLARGAELMYYGGDLVEISLAVLLAAQWYAASGRDLTRASRRLPGRPSGEGSGGEGAADFFGGAGGSGSGRRVGPSAG
jgi:putative membrane protein